METFTIGLGNRWWVRAWGSNPLARRSDRIEVVVLCLAALLTVVAMPIAGAIGTVVHEERTQHFVEEAATRHQVIATAVEDGTVVTQAKGIAFTAEATWSDDGTLHRGIVTWPERLKVGDQQSIWVNQVGDYVEPPSPPSRADSEAIGAGLVVWLSAAGASAALVYLVRCRLDRWRYAQWDREISAAYDNNGRRNHQ